MKHSFFIFIGTFFITFTCYALPKITVLKRIDINNFVEVQVANETLKELACFVAIDGHKRKFRLPPRITSQWYKATDVRYKHTDFRVWCDYIEFHPQYKNYNN